MRLHAMVIVPKGGFISMIDDRGALKGWFFSTLEQGIGILELAEQGVDNDSAMADMMNVLVSRDGLKDQVMVEGEVVRTIESMVIVAVPTGGGTSMGYPTPPATLHYAFGPQDRGTEGALLGWTDPSGQNWMAIYFTRTQARHIFKDCFGWVAQTDQRRIRELLDDPNLPNHSERTRIVIGGDLVGFFNGAYSHQMQMLGRFNILDVD